MADRLAPLVGLVGRKRAGKDTVAGRLIHAHGFVRVAFADPIRAVLLDLDPILPPTSYPGHLASIQPIRLRRYVEALGWEKAKEHPEVRRLLQTLGTEGLRTHVDPDIWLRAGMARASCWEHRPVVITDVRFENEAEAILRVGGALVRVTRPGRPSDGDEHVSETELDDWPCDAEVVNSGTLGELFEAVDKVVSTLTGHYPA